MIKNIYFIQIIRSIVFTKDTNLHPPTANLTKFQKGVYYSGIKIIFNNLPHNIKDLGNEIVLMFTQLYEIVLFWNALKRFLLINSF